MRICVVNMQSEGSLGALEFISATEKALEKVRGPDTEATVRLLKRGCVTPAQFVHPYGLYLTRGEVIERILEAEKEGYDAAVVNCTIGVGVSEARSLVNIPVVDSLEPTLLYACMLGAKFGIVAYDSPALGAQYEASISRCGLKERAISSPVKFMPMPVDFHMVQWEEYPSQVLPSVLEAAKRCVEDGADVVITAGTPVSVACTLAGLSSVEFDGKEVPILNSLVIAFKIAETMISLKNTLGLLPVARTGLYPKYAEEDLREVRASFGLKSN